MAVETKKGSTFIKHYYSSTFEDCPHYTAEITVDEDATILEMCRAFELFLKVSGYEFDGYLDFVKDDENDPFVEELVNNNSISFGKINPPRWAAENAAKAVHDEVPTGYVPKSDRNSVFDEKM